MNVNPITRLDYPDPDVIRVGDTYYMVSTTMHFMPGCEILQSFDLMHWEHVTYVYETLDHTDSQQLRNGQNIYGQGMWAASLRYHEDRFYVCFVANDTHKTYLYTSEKVSGPWKKQLIEGFYHDCSLLFDEDGRNYIVYGNDEIWITELNENLTAPKKDGLHRLLISDHKNPKLGYEGSHIYKIDGYYYIFLIHSLRDRWMRTEACFYSDSLEGEFTGADVLCDDRGYCGQGVAQGGIVDTPDGKWYAVLFQDSGAVGRIPVLIPVTWKDHFPVFGQNGHVPEEIEICSTRPDYIYQPLVGSDDFHNGLLPRWQFNHDPDPLYYCLDPLQGTYTITTREVCTELTQAVNTITQRMSYPSCAAEVTVDASELKEGDIAGLCALQGCYAAVGITKRQGKYEVLMLDKREDGILNVTDGIVVGSHQIDFRLEADFRNMKDEARCYCRVNNGDWLPIGSVHKLYFKLDHFTGCRFGLFCYAVKETGGSACFREFLYHDVDETTIINCCCKEKGNAYE